MYTVQLKEFYNVSLWHTNTQKTQITLYNIHSEFHYALVCVQT